MLFTGLPGLSRRLRAWAAGVPSQCAVCHAWPAQPVFDACLAALDYAYPWADALADFKFRADPGWAGTLSTLLRATPGVGSAIAPADRVPPVPPSAPPRPQPRLYQS